MPKKEGGGKYPPYQEDYFQRIANVHWGHKGAIFVATDINGGIIYGEVESEDKQTWKKVRAGDGRLGDDNQLIGVAYANVGDQKNKKPVFVAVGRKHTDDFDGLHIMASKDGKSWSTAYEENEEFYDEGHDIWLKFGFFGVVWDERAKLFYAQALLEHETFGDDGPHSWLYDRLYTSSSGFNWSKAQANISPDNEGFGDAYRSIILSHCSKPQNDNNKFPDGLCGYSKASDTFMKPRKLDHYRFDIGPVYSPSNNYEYFSTPDIEIRRNVKGGLAAPALGPSSATMSEDCRCIAYAGGIWAAAGGFAEPDSNHVTATVDVSFDDGKTFENVYSKSSDAYPWPEDNILAIVGAPRSDFSQSPSR